MKLLPFEKLTIESPKSMEEIHSQIDHSVMPKKLFGRSEGKPLNGERSNSEFTMYRPIAYKNSFLPVAFGTVKKDSSGCSIVINFRMNMAVNIFMFFWLSFTLLIGFKFLSKPIDIWSFVPVFMFLFGYGMMYLGFWLEVPKLKKLLRSVF
jgi:hypothetical protein